jgi:methyl-accepting chemotaxis protein
MARRSANSPFNSLQSKIRLAAGALAVFVCSFGLIAHLLISFFVGKTIFAVFVPLLLVSFAVIIFGWWLAKELLSPIERVSLLAKSLERGINVSLPKTTGSVETDEILETLRRNNQQMQSVVVLMDAVAAGNTNVILTPLENSDRLSNSFQKLLAKVSDSIDAKQNLEKLEAAIGEISEEISLVRRGNLDAKIRSDCFLTKDIAETFDYLLKNLNELVAHVRDNAGNAVDSASDAKKIVRGVVQAGEDKLTELNEIAFLLAQTPLGVRKMHDELAGSAASANQSIEKARRGTAAARANLNGVGNLRRQMQEAIKKIGNLGERSHEITRIAKAIEDLARRTNLIALNASIRAAEGADKKQGFAILAEEVERLAARAEKTSKEISSLNQSITAEIGDVGNSLQTTVGEAANLSRFAIEIGDALNELEKYVNGSLNLQTKLARVSGEQSIEVEKTLTAFAESVAATKRNISELKRSETQITAVADTAKNLQSAAAHFTLPEKVIKSSSDSSVKTSLYPETAQEFEPVVTF